MENWGVGPWCDFMLGELNLEHSNIFLEGIRKWALSKKDNKRLTNLQLGNRALTKDDVDVISKVMFETRQLTHVALYS